MNCGKHRRPSIRRPTAARQRYEQSRLSEKAETARNGNFRPAIRRPTAKVGSKTAISRQNVAAAPKRSANTGCPNKNGFSPLPAHSGDPHRTLPAFSRKNKLLSGKEPAIPPLIPEEYKRLKGFRHNQRPDPSPHGGNASYESRIFAVHLSRLPIRRAADPIDSPHNCCRSHRSRHFPQAKSSASVPTKENAITASFLEAQRPEFPSEERT